MCGIQVVLLWKEEKKKKRKKQTSNISQHQKGYSYFVGVVCAEGRQVERENWSGERQLTRLGARLAGRKNVGNKFR